MDFSVWWTVGNAERISDTQKLHLKPIQFISIEISQTSENILALTWLCECKCPGVKDKVQSYRTITTADIY